ncbi:MAG: helix-turn-helix transcriptional regulator [Leptolyngbyaceae cyanobacterium RU_5_1]|nr:helix-turn-helix transcriptional regulator [Leptolyngbyaceae cyanobacterium RU_5_1]
MKLILSQTDEDWYEALTAYGFGHQVQGADTWITMPDVWISGFIHETQLRSGLQISIEDYTPHEDLILEEHLIQSVALKFCFYLAGYSTVRSDRSFSPALTLERTPGLNYLAFGGADARLTWEFAPDQSFKIVNLWLESWLLQTFSEHHELVLPAELQQILQGNLEQPYLNLGYITPTMNVAVHQLLNCSYQGLTRQLYLESKALELVALKLEQMTKELQGSKNHKRSPLKPHDINRIYHARDILLRDIEHPPSLLALAEQAGLNDYKLKVGFHQVFGTTVFGYLRSHRMDRAHQLLTEQQMTVSEVARFVGYSSLSRFNTAFKQQFGICPSVCLGKRLP